MKTILTLVALIVFTAISQAQNGVMPGTGTSPVTVSSISPSTSAFTLKDEIAFEKAKLVAYSDASAESKKGKLPLVVMVGCNVDDISLYMQLKGKVILCYLPSNTAPFTTVESGVAVGLWNGETCVRHDVTAYTFSDQKFRETLLFNTYPPVAAPVRSLTQAEYQQMFGNNGAGQVITGYSCSGGVCTPQYAPSNGGFFEKRKNGR